MKKNIPEGININIENKNDNSRSENSQGTGRNNTRVILAIVALLGAIAYYIFFTSNPQANQSPVDKSYGIKGNSE